MSKIDFITWLKKQSGRRDPVGDIARDVVADKELPCDCKTYKEFRQYLRNLHACDGALTALDRAYAEYCGLEACIYNLRMILTFQESGK